MTEKVECINENCTAKILPATAEETGGLCMPCARNDISYKLRNYSEQDGIYEHFDLGDRLHIICPHCKNPVLLHENLDQKTKKEIASDPIEGFYTLKEICGYPFAKITILHLRKNGRCHNCGFKLKKGSLVCPSCLSVNLDWDQE